MAISVLKHLRDDMLNPGSWNALWKLDFSLFLVPITSPGKISCVSIFSHVKIFPFRVCISLPPLRTVQKETRQHFPLGSCHIPFPWTKLCDFYLFGGKPTCPSRVCDFWRIITRLILISNEWMQAESNTSSIEWWAISGERRITEESRAKSHLLVPNAIKQRTSLFLFLYQRKWSLKIFLKSQLTSGVCQSWPFGV